jgi:hypothetical protein
MEALGVMYVGVQGGSSDETTWARSLLTSGADAPDHLERGRFVDDQGVTNEVIVCYWRDPATYARFIRRSAFTRWARDDARLSGESGVWIESFAAPIDHVETLLASPEPVGSAHVSSDPAIADVLESGYWGAMRDRTPASAVDDLASPLPCVRRIERPDDTRGRRILLEAPANLCVIRSAQDWSASAGEERRAYLEQVHPLLVNGMRYLREEPEASGCVACRLMDGCTTDGEPLDQTFAAAWFLDMARLEEWAERHPTHLAIFNTFRGMVDRLGGRTTLNLWHEVAVLPQGRAHLECVNCHPRTGMLPFLEEAKAG